MKSAVTFMAEHYQQGWAVEMRHWLVRIKTAVETARSEGRQALYLDQIAWFNHRYSVILDEAADEVGPPPPSTTGRRSKHTPPANLLKRLRDGRDQVLAFMTDFTVPFDNNLAERDLRMVKVQQKVSGGFRQLSAAHAFCAVRSYLATARKNGQSALTVLRHALSARPYFPPCVLPSTPV